MSDSIINQVLIAAEREAGEKNIDFKLKGISGIIKKQFRIAGLSK